MTKKLTLSEAWNRCLAMWKWIDKQIVKGTDLKTEKLKRKWLKTQQKKYKLDNLRMNCFFCEYGKQHKEWYQHDCESCPGRLINRKFHCSNASYHYYDRPRKFYKKLLELNEKRRQHESS